MRLCYVLGTLFCSVLIAEIAFDSRCFVVGEYAVVDENFADLAVEVFVVDAQADCAGTGHTVERMLLAALGEGPKAVDVDLVGVFVVDGAGDRKVLANAACRPCVAKIIADLRGPEARIDVCLIGAYEGVSPEGIFGPEDGGGFRIVGRHLEGLVRCSRRERRSSLPSLRWEG